MYVYTVWRSSHAEPKSMILIIGLSRFLSRMFSGFKSQWISLALFNRLSPFRSCWANTRTSVVLNPRNWFCLISSYKLTLRSSNTKQRCCLWMKVSFNRRRWWSSFLSSFVFNYSKASAYFLCLLGRLSYQIEDRHFHHTLVEVGCPVLHYLYCHDFLSFQILALDYLTESSLAKDIEDKVPVSETCISNLHRKEYRNVDLDTYLWPVSSDPRMSFT